MIISRYGNLVKSSLSLMCRYIVGFNLMNTHVKKDFFKASTEIARRNGC